jgi:hypothetical protein
LHKNTYQFLNLKEKMKHCRKLYSEHSLPPS